MGHVSAQNPRLGPQSLAPALPEDADSIMEENGLETLPPSRLDFSRPWFLYDFVDPAPKFRVMDDKHDWSRNEEAVSSGSNDDKLIDEPLPGNSIPVLVKSYQCVFTHTHSFVFLIMYIQATIHHNPH